MKRLSLVVVGTAFALLAVACEFDPDRVISPDVEWTECNGLVATEGYGYQVGTDPAGGSSYVGTPGDDVVVLVNGPVEYFAGGGNDTVCVVDVGLDSGPGSIVVHGGTGDDTVLVRSDVPTDVFGDQGNDSLVGAKLGSGHIDGGPDDDACTLDGVATTNCETEYHPSGLPLCADPALCLHPGSDASIYDLDVLSIRFLPDEDSDGVIDVASTNYVGTVDDLRSRIDEMERQGAWWATEATRYRGYADPAVVPSIEFEVTEQVEFLTNPPQGLPFNNVYRPDYDQILTNLDICHHVDVLGIQEVWMYTQHAGNIEPAESNMSSAVGDFSNSERTDDLPHCNRSYVVYNFNFARGVAEMLHNRGHQIEAQFGRDSGLFWTQFVGAAPGSSTIPQPAACGWTHVPPNGQSQYDTWNSIEVDSYCEDWSPGGGFGTPTSCLTWQQAAYGLVPNCTDDGGLAFYVWWMQNMPGEGNNLPYGGGGMRNWWQVMAEFDLVMNEFNWLWWEIN